MGRKIGGNKDTKEDKFIKQFLYESDRFYKYEVLLIYEAFKKTLLYFLENCIEFEIKNFFTFKKKVKKGYRLHVNYSDEYVDIPEHNIMKITMSQKFKDYINHRGEFKDVQRREILIDGIKRTKNIF